MVFIIIIISSYFDHVMKNTPNPLQQSQLQFADEDRDKRLKVQKQKKRYYVDYSQSQILKM